LHDDGNQDYQENGSLSSVCNALTCGLLQR
jgi:hypothetical protein